MNVILVGYNPEIKWMKEKVKQNGGFGVFRDVGGLLKIISELNNSIVIFNGENILPYNEKETFRAMKKVNKYGVPIIITHETSQSPLIPEDIMIDSTLYLGLGTISFGNNPQKVFSQKINRYLNN